MTDYLSIPDGPSCDICRFPIGDDVFDGKPKCLSGRTNICRSCCGCWECENFRDEQAVAS